MKRTKHVSTLQARSRVAVSIIAGLIAAVAFASQGYVFAGALVGWCVTALTFMVGLWSHIWPMDEHATAEHASQEDPTRAMSFAVLLFTSIASLGGTGVIMAQASNAHGSTKVLLALLGVSTVIVSWLLVHTIYTLRYTVLYFSQPIGGVSFNKDIRPTYSDFAYLAFTLGVAYQVSDTAFETRKFRKIALFHALFSYMFGAAIVAATINLLVSLGR